MIREERAWVGHPNSLCFTDRVLPCVNFPAHHPLRTAMPKTKQHSFVAPRRGGPAGALADASWRRAADVAKDARGLSARHRTIPRLPGAASGAARRR